MNFQYVHLDRTQASFIQAVESSSQHQDSTTIEFYSVNETAVEQHQFQAREMPSLHPNETLESDLIEWANPIIYERSHSPSMS